MITKLIYDFNQQPKFIFKSKKDGKEQKILRLNYIIIKTKKKQKHINEHLRFLFEALLWIKILKIIYSLFKNLFNDSN